MKIQEDQKPAGVAAKGSNPRQALRGKLASKNFSKHTSSSLLLTVTVESIDCGNLLILKWDSKSAY